VSISKKLRLIPRAPGDTTALDPAIADAMRTAGIDPAKFTAAPFEGGDVEEAIAAIAKAGPHVEHTFLFPTLNGAFSAMEKLLDERASARISKAPDGWLVVFDAADEPGAADAAAHERFASVARSLGAHDRGVAKMNVTVNRSVTVKKAPPG